MRLNKYLAQSGIASRRGSDRLIKAATITVNNIVVTDPAYDIKENDIVKYDGKNIQINTASRIPCAMTHGFMRSDHRPPTWLFPRTRPRCA